MRKLFFALGVLCFAFQITQGQTKPIAGTAVKDFGKFFPVENPGFKTDFTQNFKVVIDVQEASPKPEEIHPLLNTAARYLNMHTWAGVPLKDLHVALVVHGGASDAILTDEAYKAKHGITNPNTPLIEQLNQAGVQIILCGQTAGARGITDQNRNVHVQVALSALTALVQLQNQGYQLIEF
jgi:intracellular sulfur oxidation DsrE/DsrF family protein